MGAQNASPGDAPVAASVNPEVDRERAREDLWFAIVEQASAFLPNGIVLEWDKDEIQQIVHGISALDVEKHWDFRAATARGMEVSVGLETEARYWEQSMTHHYLVFIVIIAATTGPYQAYTAHVAARAAVERR